MVVEVVVVVVVLPSNPIDSAPDVKGKKKRNDSSTPSLAVLRPVYPMLTLGPFTPCPKKYHI